jgi:hypothetical protein
MARKCYISFKTEDEEYKLAVQNLENLEIIDRSLNIAIESEDEDYIMRKIREDYLSDSTVTIHLIGAYGAEDEGWEEQKYIKRELQASLYHREGNTKSGILGIVLPSMENAVYGGSYLCGKCLGKHNLVRINDSTTVKEFSGNYYVQPHSKCSYTEDERYCVLVRWQDFLLDPEKYIELAYEKRTAPVASKTRVKPKD